MAPEEGAAGAGDGQGPGDTLKLGHDAPGKQHFIRGGPGALPQDARGMPWTGDYVFSSGDLVEDLTHNFFLETGARNNKLSALFNGPHPETGEEPQVVDHAPEGFAPVDLPPQPAVFAPDYAPEEIAAIAQKLRKAAGLPDEPLGEVANPGNGNLASKVAD